MLSVKIPLFGSVGETGELAGSDKGWKFVAAVGFGGTGGGMASFAPELLRGIAGGSCDVFAVKAISLPSWSLQASLSSAPRGLLKDVTCVSILSLLSFVTISCFFACSSVCGVCAGCRSLVHRTAVIRFDDRARPPPPAVTDLNSMVSGSISRRSDDSRPEAFPLQWAYDLPCLGDLGGII